MNKLKEFINTYKSIPVQVKASVWYTICNLLQKGISFLIVPIYVRVLTTAEYGQYTVFQSWRSILIIFATLNLYAGVFTKAMIEYDDDRDRYTSCMQGLSTVITAVLFGVYLINSNMWNNLIQMDKVTIGLLFVYFVFSPAFSFWSARQRVEYKYVSMVVVTLLTSVATPFLSVFLLYFTDLRSNAVIYGYLFVYIIVGMYFYTMQFVKGKCFYNKNYWIRALKFNIPLIPHYLSMILLVQIDRIMIGYYCGEAEVGIYALAYQISMAMNILIAAINNSIVPWTYEQLKQKEYQGMKMVSNMLCILLATLTICIILVAPEIILIMGTKEYLEAMWIIPAVAISVYYTFCYWFYSNVEFYFGATKFVMIASTLGAILNTILNAWLIPIYGYIVAGYTTLISYLFFVVLHYCFSKEICKKRLGHNDVYDNKFIIGSCVWVTMFGLGCMLLYKHTFIRYCMLGIGIIAGFIHRNKVFAIIKRIKK